MQQTEKKGEERNHPSQNSTRSRITYTLRPCAIALVFTCLFTHQPLPSSVHILNCPSAYLIIHFMQFARLLFLFLFFFMCSRKFWSLFDAYTNGHLNMLFVSIKLTGCVWACCVHLSDRKISIRWKSSERRNSQSKCTQFRFAFLVSHSIQITFNDTARSAASFFPAFISKRLENKRRERDKKKNQPTTSMICRKRCFDG